MTRTPFMLLGAAVAAGLYATPAQRVRAAARMKIPSVNITEPPFPHKKNS